MGTVLEILIILGLVWAWVNYAWLLIKGQSTKPTQAELSRRALGNKPPPHVQFRTKNTLRKGKINSVRSTNFTKN